MQHKAVYSLFCKFTLHFSGVIQTDHQEYTKNVTTASGTGHIFGAATSIQSATLKGGSCTKNMTAWPRWREVAAQNLR